MGGNWTGLLSDGPWIPGQQHDEKSQRRRNDLDDRLSRHVARLGEVYAVVSEGQWQLSERDKRPGFVERLLRSTNRQLWVTIVDCHS